MSYSSNAQAIIESLNQVKEAFLLADRAMVSSLNQASEVLDKNISMFNRGLENIDVLETRIKKSGNFDDKKDNDYYDNGRELYLTKRKKAVERIAELKKETEYVQLTMESNANAALSDQEIEKYVDALNEINQLTMIVKQERDYASSKYLVHHDYINEATEKEYYTANDLIKLAEQAIKIQEQKLKESNKELKEYDLYKNMSALSQEKVNLITAIKAKILNQNIYLDRIKAALDYFKDMSKNKTYYALDLVNGNEKLQLIIEDEEGGGDGRGTKQSITQFMFMLKNTFGR